MCGGGKRRAAPAPAPAPVQMTYNVPADNSNQQRQVAAISAEAGKTAPGTSASYGSELASAGAS